MNRMKRYSNYLILTFILGLFIFAFYALSYIYTLSHSRSQIFVLNSNIFQAAAAHDNEKQLYVSNAIKKDLSYQIFGTDVLDDDSIIFRTDNEKESSNEKICTLSLDSNKLNEIYRNSGNILNNASVSEDGKKIIYSDIPAGGNTGKTYAYDTETKQSKTILDSVTNAGLISNNRYIGVNSDYLFIKDLDTGDIKNLLSLDKLKKFASDLPKPNNKVIKSKQVYEPRVSGDGNIIYFSYQIYNNNENYAYIMEANLKNNESFETVLKGSIYDFMPLNDGNFLFCGDIGESKGIFIYNMKSKSYKSLKQGDIFKLDLTEDNTKIAYGINNSNGNNSSIELHAAFFNKDKIESDTIVYSDPKYGFNLKWNKSGDKLFYFCDKAGGTVIYRFSF